MINKLVIIRISALISLQKHHLFTSYYFLINYTYIRVNSVRGLKDFFINITHYYMYDKFVIFYDTYVIIHFSLIHHVKYLYLLRLGFIRDFNFLTG